MESTERNQRLAEERRIRLAKALFLTAAFLSFLVSVALWFSGDRERGLFGVAFLFLAGAYVLFRAGFSSAGDRPTVDAARGASR